MNIEKYLERFRTIFLALVATSSAILVGLQESPRYLEAEQELNQLHEPIADWDRELSFWDKAGPVVRRTDLFDDLSKMYPMPSSDDQPADLVFFPRPYHFVSLNKPVVIALEAEKYVQTTVSLRLYVPAALVPRPLVTLRGESARPFEIREFWEALQKSPALLSSIPIEKIEVFFRVDEDRLETSGIDEGDLAQGIVLEGRLRIEDGPADVSAQASALDALDVKTTDGREVYGIEAEVFLPVRIETPPGIEKWCSLFREFATLGCADFEDRFPNLSRVLDRYPKDLGVDGLHSLIEMEHNQDRKFVSVAGFEVPKERVLAASFFLLFAIGVYYAIHLREFRFQLEIFRSVPAAVGVPWVGLFRGSIPFLISTIGCGVLPVAALSWASWVSGSREVFSWPSGALILAMVLFCWITAEHITLRRIWFRQVQSGN